MMIYNILISYKTAVDNLIKTLHIFNSNIIILLQPDWPIRDIKIKFSSNPSRSRRCD